MGKYLLGEFEHLVLLATIRCEDDAYGVSITEELSERTGKDVSQAATYLTLKRLEEKGWLEGRSEQATPERGGRPKRVYVVTPEGLARLRESRDVLQGMWSAIQGQLG